MRFKLELELGNAAMLTYGDLAAHLDRLARKLRSCGEDTEPTHNDGTYERDDNGNRIGSWKVTK